MTTIIEDLARCARDLRAEAARLHAAGNAEAAGYAIHSARAAEQLAGIKPPKAQRDMLDELAS